MNQLVFQGRLPAGARTYVNSVVGNPGQILPTRLLESLNACLGHDLRLVRVHTDVAAARSAEAIGARAYAVGHHIVFGRGQYCPETEAGRLLLVHELIHALQQTAGTPATGTGESSEELFIAPEDGPHEAEATQLSREVVEAWSRGRTASRPVRVRPAIRGIYRVRICMAPSRVVPNDLAIAIGRVIPEPIIQADYCSTPGVGPCALDVTDWFDGAGVDSYIRFLALNNPHINDDLEKLYHLKKQSQIAGGARYPDILTHKPLRQEYYEIKPDSPGGQADGEDKMGNLDVIYDKGNFNLPYKRGRRYAPKDEMKPILEPAAFIKDMNDWIAKNPRLKGACIKAYLKWRLSQPGLLQYMICFDFGCVELQAEEMLKACRYLTWLLGKAVAPAQAQAAAAGMTQVTFQDLPSELNPLREKIAASVQQVAAEHGLVPGWKEQYILVASRELYNSAILAPGAARLQQLKSQMGVTWDRLLASNPVAMLRTVDLAIAGIAIGTGIVVTVVAMPIVFEVGAGAAVTAASALGAGAPAAGAPAVAAPAVAAPAVAAPALPGAAAAGAPELKLIEVGFRAFLRSPAANDVVRGLAKVGGLILVGGSVTLASRSAQAATPPGAESLRMPPGIGGQPAPETMQVNDIVTMRAIPATLVPGADQLTLGNDVNSIMTAGLDMVYIGKVQVEQ